MSNMSLRQYQRHRSHNIAATVVSRLPHVNVNYVIAAELPVVGHRIGQ